MNDTTNLIDLRKKVIISLAKVSKTPIIAKVGLVMDISGSMKGLYNRGVVQEAVDRVLAIGGEFDDDGDIDMWLFDDKHQNLGQVTEADFGDYVNTHILANGCKTIKWGYTKYTPVMQDVMRYFYGTTGEAPKKQGFLSKLFSSNDTVPSNGIPEGREDENDDHPVYIAFITDGDASDINKFMPWAKATFAGRKIFIQCVTIGNYNSKKLTELSEDMPNVGYFKYEDAKNDSELYDLLISKKLVDYISS